MPTKTRTNREGLLAVLSALCQVALTYLIAVAVTSASWLAALAAGLFVAVRRPDPASDSGGEGR